MLIDHTSIEAALFVIKSPLFLEEVKIENRKIKTIQKQDIFLWINRYKLRTDIKSDYEIEIARI